jgi:predicted nuclease of predicted toxin-antitoxin system
MKLLLDKNLPHRLRPLLVGHEAFTIAYMKWNGIENGSLLALAAKHGFDALLTKDSGVEYQQNPATLPCSVVILETQSKSLKHIQPLIPALLDVLQTPPRASSCGASAVRSDSLTSRLRYQRRPHSFRSKPTSPPRKTSRRRSSS